MKLSFCLKWKNSKAKERKPFGKNCIGKSRPLSLWFIALLSPSVDFSPSLHFSLYFLPFSLFPFIFFLFLFLLHSFLPPFLFSLIFPYFSNYLGRHTPIKAEKEINKWSQYTERTPCSAVLTRQTDTQMKRAWTLSQSGITSTYCGEWLTVWEKNEWTRYKSS